MKRPSPLATMSLLVAAAVLAACGSDDQGRAGSAPAVTATSTASPAPSGPATSAPTTSPTSKSPASTPSGSHTPSSGHVLTLADNGKTVSLAVGQSVSVRLGGPWLWREPVVDGRAIDVAQVNFLVDPGYSEWAVRGLRAGRATLQINGEANCPTEGDTVCILGAKVFAVTFAVG